MLPAAIAYSLGGAALVAGGVTGFLAFQKTDEVKDLCGGAQCPEKYAGEVDAALSLGTASTVLFAMGGLGAATGLILTFTVGVDGGEGESKENEEKAAQVRVRPFVGPATAGVIGTF